MSYIRCLSNPESAYVWSEGKRVRLWMGEYYKNRVEWSIPQYIFNKVCDKWEAEGDHAKHRGFEVKKVWVNQKGKVIVPPDIFTMKGFKAALKNPVDLKIQLSWKGESFYLWDVTWESIVRHSQWGVTWDNIKKPKQWLKKLGRG